MRFDENPFTYQSEKEDRKAEEFQISHFYWSFSSDVMAVKGLILIQREDRNKKYTHLNFFSIALFQT